MKSSSSPSGLEVVADGQMNLSQQCALAANRADCSLGCIEPCTGIETGKGLSHSALCCSILTSNLVFSFVFNNTKRM